MIELQNVTKFYDESTRAVDNISFEVNEGETFGLIGTSGCGKTTTLKMINRLVEATSGKILIKGKSVLELPSEELRRNIGYVIQNIGLFPHYTIEENVAVVPELMKWEEERIQYRTRELLNLVGLDPQQFSGRLPKTLSGGQQQRVGLARALAADPDILLMDEPFGALDPLTKEEVRKEFKKLLHDLDKTIILVTHDVFEAFDICDRICLMDSGKIRQEGTPKELLFRPADEFVHSFFDNHRLQLEMMSVSVGDILEIPDYRERFSLQEKRPKSKTIYANDTFYSVFSKVSAEEEFILILNNKGAPLFGLTTDDLLKGFHHLRSNLKKGGFQD